MLLMQEACDGAGQIDCEVDVPGRKTGFGTTAFDDPERGCQRHPFDG